MEDIENYLENSPMENIWNGRTELTKILTLLDQKNFCKSISKRSNAYYISYFKYCFDTAVPKTSGQIIIEDKPTIILRTIKKRTEFYVTFDELPEVMELDFEKKDKSFGIRHWKWLGDPLSEIDFKRLELYVATIIGISFNPHVL